MSSLAYWHEFVGCCQFVVWLVLFGCAHTTQVDLPAESVSYRSAVQPAAEYSTIYERSSAASDTYLRWHAAHEKLAAAIGQPRLAFFAAHQQTLAALAALQHYHPDRVQALETYAKRYEQLAQQVESGAAPRSLLHRYEALREEITHTVQPATTDAVNYPGGQASGRPASR